MRAEVKVRYGTWSWLGQDRQRQMLDGLHPKELKVGFESIVYARMQIMVPRSIEVTYELSPRMAHPDSPQVPPARDRRRAERVRPGPLRVCLHRTCEGTVLDISELGALVQLPTAQKPEKQIMLYLEWKYEMVQLRALVVRSIPHPVLLRNAVLARAEHHVALEFRGLPQDATAALKRILRDSTSPEKRA